MIIGLFVSIIQLTLCTGSHPVIVNVLTWFSYISSFVAYCLLVSRVGIHWF